MALNNNYNPFLMTGPLGEIRSSKINSEAVPAMLKARIPTQKGTFEKNCGPYSPRDCYFTMDKLLVWAKTDSTCRKPCPVLIRPSKLQIL